MIEFFIPCPLFCCFPRGDNSKFVDTLKKEFPDGIKNSILTKPKSMKGMENAEDQSYEQLARDSTVGASNPDEENNEENKVGDLEQSKDLRYNIDAIIENSICQKFDRNRLYNWHTARVYSVIDILNHPMHGPAKKVLTRHLERLQKIEAEQQLNNTTSDEETDGSGIYEEEEEESESEDEELNEQLRNIRAAKVKAIPRPSASSAPPPSGAFKYGNTLPTKSQVIDQYNTMVDFKIREFNQMEAKIPEEQKAEFHRQKDQYLTNMKSQKDELLRQISQQPSQSNLNGQEEIGEAFMIGNDEEEEEEEEVEEEEESEEEKQTPQLLTKITEMSKDDSEEEPREIESSGDEGDEEVVSEVKDDLEMGEGEGSKVEAEGEQEQEAEGGD